MKLYNGTISNWRKVEFNKTRYPDLPDNLGFVIQGTSRGHPKGFKNIRTSPVVKHNKQTGEIETLNSRYSLVGEDHEVS